MALPYEQGTVPNPPPAPAPSPRPNPAPAAQPQDPAQAAGYTGERKDESTVGEKDWDPGWERRVGQMVKSGALTQEEASQKNLWDPKHRAYINQKMKQWQASKKKKPASGTSSGSGETSPATPPTGGTETMPQGSPPKGTPPPPNEWPQGPPGGAPGGWLPNRNPMPWGGGGRVNWGQGPGQSQGYPGAPGAGYPGAPNYPQPGQNFPIPGMPGGPVQTIPGRQGYPGYPGYPPPGRGYPGRPGFPPGGINQPWPGPGGQAPGRPPTGPPNVFDPYGSGGAFEGQQRPGPGGFQNLNEAIQQQPWQQYPTWAPQQQQQGPYGQYPPQMMHDAMVRR